MKKPMSQMSAHEFVESMAALGLTPSTFAQALGKSRPSVSNYKEGRARIPLEVTQKISQLIWAKRNQLAMASHMVDASSVADLIAYHNQVKKPRTHQTEGRLMNRQHKPDQRLYPAYRMTRERFTTYLLSLAAWQARIRELARQYPDELRQRDYHLELADLKALADGAPRHAPYDIYIERSQWLVVARALLHANSNAASALYQHWRRHRGSGYPVERARGAIQ